MEGALGERLRREFGLSIDGPVAMAPLVRTEAGRDALERLWTGYIDIARAFELPFLATTPTRRANQERMAQAGMDDGLLSENVQFLKSICRKTNYEQMMYVGALMGCRGDAYSSHGALSAEDARKFHTYAARIFARAGVDFLYAGIMPALCEAIGMAQAMSDSGVEYIISFMIRGDGCLLDGTSIDRAIEQIDRAAQRPPVCYMVNCVHPRVLFSALAQPFNRTVRVRKRFRGIQANASALPPEALDHSARLHGSDPEALAEEMVRLADVADIAIYGGCCGTDHTHMRAIAQRIGKAKCPAL